MKRTYQAPRLVLSAESLAGEMRAPRERLLEIGGRFQEPEALAVALSKALDAGAEGVLAAPSPALHAALAELDRTVPLFAVLPALRANEWLDLDPGVDALLARACKRAGPITRFRMGWTGFWRASAFRRGDFAARMPGVLEGEAAVLPRRGVAGVVLRAALTDLALAGGHRRFFEGYVKFVHARFRASAALETANLGTLLERLEEWGVAPDFVVGPVNPPGLRMKPTPQHTLLQMARCDVPVVAKDLRAGGLVTLEEGARFALANGAHGLAPDLADVDDVSAELRKLRA